jgi:hypothetical protein
MKLVGEFYSTFYKHPKSPHPYIFRESVDKNEGFIGIGMSCVMGNKKTKLKTFGYLRRPIGKYVTLLLKILLLPH